MTISKLICDEDTYEMNYAFNAYDSINSSTCDDESVCKYSMFSEEANSSVYCDAYVEGEINELTTGNSSLLFWLYLVCQIVWAYCVGPAWNFVDAVASKKCEKVNIDWAWANVAGNVGSVLAPLITGQIIVKIQMGDEKTDCLSGLIIDEFDYRLPFYFCAVALALTAITTMFLNIDIKPVRTNIAWYKELSWLITFPALGFYLTLIIHGMLIGVSDGFYAIFVIEKLNVSEEWYSNLFTISVISNIFLNVIIGIVHRYIGSMNVINLLAATSTIRIIVVPFLSKYQDGAVPVELIILTLLDHAGAVYVGVVGYVPQISPSHLRASAIGMCASCIFVIGRGFGSLLSGLVSDQIGVPETLKIFGFAGLGYHLAYFVLYHSFIKHKEQPEKFKEPSKMIAKEVPGQGNQIELIENFRHNITTNDDMKSDEDKKGLNKDIEERSLGDKLDLAEKVPEQVDYLFYTHF